MQPDTSIERVFVPGIGLVRETRIMGVANLTLLRQEITLEAPPQQHA